MKKQQPNITFKVIDITCGNVFVTIEEAGNYISRQEVIRILRKIERGDWKAEDVLDVLIEN